MTIHSEDPFATPEEQRSPVRRLRGRAAAAVTLWTAGEGTGRAGLTVSSALVADGQPGRLLGLVDDESDFWAAARPAGRFAYALLGPDDKQLADRFAGLLPAPGGLFLDPVWTQTAYGPVLASASAWAGCRIDDARGFGWGLLVEATIEEITLGPAAPPLLYHRGRYRELP
ncbi:flavin reductase family protein [Hamadaea tsunoensis]|uniref:flavin reductase family protein n=1 Tax=Hamadaea tsunoensis TaxID=53368 RepID=UPI00041A5AE1|nr:flavin reductase family protein [Hamadaea tsunoensis]